MTIGGYLFEIRGHTARRDARAVWHLLGQNSLRLRELNGAGAASLGPRLVVLRQ
jgi:hypothetical protein